MKTFPLQNRTKLFSLKVIELTETFPKSIKSPIVANQIIRSATSVAANYRSASKAKSDKDFIYKMKIAEEEADETQFWLEIVNESGLDESEKTKILLEEAKEISAIICTIIKKVKARINDKSLS